MSGLEILSVAPTTTVQDRGRSGFLRYGVTGGGAMDVFALAEGQALLGNDADAAALEFAAFGGRFRAKGGFWVATSGAEMALAVNGAAMGWRRSFRLEDGDIVDVGAAMRGVYGYLHVTGGLQTEVVLGSRATHLRAGFGHVPSAGDLLAVGKADREASAWVLPEPAYFQQSTLRLMWGPQSEYFTKAERDRFAAANFIIRPERDRMGIRVQPDCGPVHADAGLTIASDAINLGDIQITGDGTPAILLADRGPSGGYPRIATLATADIPALAQMQVGAKFRLEVVTREQAVALLAAFRERIRALPGQMAPALRDPRDMGDLLSYNLIGGVMRGDEHDED
ncbi:MAG: biotin-dependent carboxyltransferase family protein [Rhodobacteraceae bacterium]|nr:biotin-dependent carboxyltransferase family protein [Paracoccaceae bacterium]